MSLTGFNRMLFLIIWQWFTVLGHPLCSCLNIKINNSKQTKRYHAQNHILLFIISDHKLN